MRVDLRGTPLFQCVCVSVTLARNGQAQGFKETLSVPATVRMYMCVLNVTVHCLSDGLGQERGVMKCHKWLPLTGEGQ